MSAPCNCNEPDGDCEGCDDEHGHTCIICGYDFCQACWETRAHNDDCDPQERERRLA